MQRTRTYINVEVSKALKHKLRAIARRERRTLTEIARFALEERARNGSNSAGSTAPPTVG